ncbi:Signal transduction histidine kinase [Thermomonospora echinospora]|uniref:histidine kinase n=1 Tax=Thermomonospora echinospora TaxID=1992 RepID=A0A1H5XRE0_9ACTN|nr:Signal transduction histidine kinase [Thermomonospora echinospora]
MLRLVAAAALTGVADPPPAHRDWPSWLRWTRLLGVGRLPYGAVVVTIDLVIALTIFGGTYNQLFTEAHARNPGWLLLIAAAALAIPVALRDRHPVAAWRMAVAAMAVTAPWHWVDVPYVPGGAIATLLCLYSLAVRSPRAVTLGAGLICAMGAWAVDSATAIGVMVLVSVPLLVGAFVRERRAARRELAEQERRHKETEAVLKERQRIARELHDVVAHHMSMIAIQAEAAPYAEPGMPERTRSDLAQIRATALEALTEMRRVLGVLRTENGAETAPQPGLDRLEELVAGARGAGLDVTVETTGDPGPLPPGYGLTAYRIVQEALSNAMRHAPGSRVDVTVHYGHDALRLGVANGPPPRQAPPPSPGGGHGLIGMRERAAMLDGELTTGPTPEGGFAVTAVLPWKTA